MRDDFIRESMEQARGYFRGLGFNDDQIGTLLSSGEKDLGRELEKIGLLIAESPLDTEKLNSSLHAVKGLLLNMGCHDAAGLFNGLRENVASEANIDGIKELIATV